MFAAEQKFFDLLQSLDCWKWPLNRTNERFSGLSCGLFLRKTRNADETKLHFLIEKLFLTPQVSDIDLQANKKLRFYAGNGSCSHTNWLFFIL